MYPVQINEKSWGKNVCKRTVPNKHLGPFKRPSKTIKGRGGFL